MIILNKTHPELVYYRLRSFNLIELLVVVSIICLAIISMGWLHSSLGWPIVISILVPLVIITAFFYIMSKLLEVFDKKSEDKITVQDIQKLIEIDNQADTRCKLIIVRYGIKLHISGIEDKAVQYYIQEKKTAVRMAILSYLLDSDNISSNHVNIIEQHPVKSSKYFTIINILRDKAKIIES